MNNEWILAALVVGALVLALDITRRAFMELQRLEYEQRIKKEMRRLRAPKLPWVTVLVYGEDGPRLSDTLRQVHRNRYAYFDVVRVKKDTAAGYRTAYRKSKRGEIIVCVRAGDAIDTQCIKRAVAVRSLQLARPGRVSEVWKVSIPNAEGVANGIRGIAQQLSFALWAPSAPAVFAYTRQGLRMLARVKVPVKNGTLGLPVLVLFIVIIVATALLNTALFVYGWLLFSAYLFVLIWLSSPTRLSVAAQQSDVAVRKKLQLSFAVPSALLLIPVARFIGGIFQLSARK